MPRHNIKTYILQSIMTRSNANSIANKCFYFFKSKHLFTVKAQMFVVIQQWTSAGRKYNKCFMFTGVFFFYLFVLCPEFLAWHNMSFGLTESYSITKRLFNGIKVVSLPAFFHSFLLIAGNSSGLQNQLCLTTLIYEV